MKIINQKRTVSSTVFSKPAAILYLLVLLFFVYKILTILPTWFTLKDEAKQREFDYNKKVEFVNDMKEREKDNQTDVGKERYQKEFFNKLDEGENLIILYGQEQKSLKQEEERKMFFWEEWEQNFKVWWRNLEIF